MKEKKLNVLFVVGGYPTPDDLSHGVFNKRAAESLSEFVNLTVLHYRIFKLDRKFFEKSQESSFVKYTLCVPFIPVFQKKLFLLNNLIFLFFTKIYASNLFRTTSIVHTGDGVLSVFISKLKKKYNFKLIAQFIGGDINQDLDGYEKSFWVEKWLNNLDGVTYNSNALKQRFDALFGSHSNNRVIYRGINLEVFRPVEKKANDFRFYFLGGLPNYTTFKHGRNTKGGIHLMKAWQMIDSNSDFDQVYMHLSFAGPDSDIDLTHQWKNSLRFPERVSLIGKLSHNEILAFHQNNTILLLPSLEEGLPNVSVEASAVGNCIIATKAGGIPEVIENEINGLLCEGYTADSLYDVIIRILNNKSLVQKYGLRAREKVECNFNSSNFSKHYFEFYNKILSA
jgi:glycosyltransferase involved in cell wall biosynthesis